MEVCPYFILKEKMGLGLEDGLKKKSYKKRYVNPDRVKKLNAISGWVWEVIR
jgi:hypothetical protein